MVYTVHLNIDGQPVHHPSIHQLAVPLTADTSQLLLSAASLGPVRHCADRPLDGPGEYCAGPALQARLHEIILQSLSSALFAERA